MAGESISWIAPDASTTALDGSSNYLALEGEQDTYMRKVALLDQRTPQRPGTNVRYADLPPCVVTYPLQVSASSETNLRTAIRTLTQKFGQTLIGTPPPSGTLRATAPDGSTTRDLVCFYFAGLEGDGRSPNRSPGSIIFPLQLLATDPLWQDSASTTAGPYTNTQMGSTQTINITGDYQCWPTWTLTGPFVNMVITNTTTGKAIKLTANGGISLANGDTLTINSIAGTVVKNSSSAISNLTVDSILFPLVPGNNAITFTYTGGVLGQTTAQAVYKNRWFSC